MTDKISKARDTAYTLYNEIEGCMYDLANGNEFQADNNWNDPEVLGDLLGDRIYDACNCLRTDDDKILAWEVSDNLLEIGHDAFKEAVNQFKERQEFI